MKLYLGMALALHAAVLGGGARWARSRQAAGWAAATGAPEEIVISTSPPPPRAAEIPAVPAEPPRTASPASRPGSTAGGARPGPGPRHTEAVRPPVPVLHGEGTGPGEAAFKMGGAPATTAVPAEASGETAQTRGTSLGGDGDGEDEGSGNAGRARRRRKGLGESWDSVAGPRSEDLPQHTAHADERTLPRRVVEEVVRRSAGRLLHCYQDGLRREPDLAGQIPVSFAVDPGGSVLVASDGGSTIADPAVVRCVLSTFAAMTFPARPGGAVQTTYVVAFPPR